MRARRREEDRQRRRTASQTEQPRIGLSRGIGCLTGGVSIRSRSGPGTSERSGDYQAPTPLCREAAAFWGASSSSVITPESRNLLSLSS